MASRAYSANLHFHVGVRIGLVLAGRLGWGLLDVAVNIVVADQAAAYVGDRHRAVVRVCFGKHRPQVIQAANYLAVDLDDDIVRLELVVLGGEPGATCSM